MATRRRYSLGEYYCYILPSYPPGGSQVSQRTNGASDVIEIVHLNAFFLLPFYFLFKRIIGKQYHGSVRDPDHKLKQNVKLALYFKGILE